MSRHSSAKMGPEIFFFMATIVLGAIFPLFWLWFLPRYSIAFNTLAVKSGISPFNSLILMEFFAWPIVMIIYFKARF
jgi:hypothetical protein